LTERKHEFLIHMDERGFVPTHLPDRGPQTADHCVHRYRAKTFDEIALQGAPVLHAGIRARYRPASPGDHATEAPVGSGQFRNRGADRSGSAGDEERSLHARKVVIPFRMRRTPGLLANFPHDFSEGTVP
jgi:hypothetical protein